ncbi:uncharacterized protein KGF55_004689 [Candida pseudojiufengensis]|uniref:uncharacterized protein n=1 Tax=Candida pseudojiufengensis TaxID=497109 RepID=UPI0022246AFB|nr:uncharacterized protein KGF55_004689 [Candida pseudojiufengensis]KAI5960397.1 hypothetical protein KGF55_004689 [Candida pseudojiufengensis]
MPQLSNSILVLLGGGHASGKKTTAIALKKELLSSMPESSINVKIIDMNEYTTYGKSSVDSSQFPNSKSAAITVNKEEFFQSFPKLKPSRFDFTRLKNDLNEMNQTSSDRSTQDIIIVHGLYALYDKDLREMSHIKVFIDSDSDTRLIRWINRDVLTNKVESLETVINAYLLGARIEMSDYIFPTKEFSDVIMPRGFDANAVKLIIDGILLYFNDKSIQPKRSSLPANNLRPAVIGNFEKEKFDVQKNKFYQLN